MVSADDVDALIGNELRLRALDDYIVVLAPVQQTAGPREHTLLSLCATFLREGIMIVARESAREVLANVAVRHLLCAIHQHLCTIVELWDAVHRQQQGESLLQGECVLAVS